MAPPEHLAGVSQQLGSSMAALQAQLQQTLENQGLLDEAQIELLSPGQQTLYREAED